MRVLVFHGYLLRGTGSNVYNANLASALVRLGHEVHLLCQERHADELEFVGAVGDWDSGALEIERLRDSACTVYRPDIGGVLPVYVADRYEGIEALPFPELTDRQLETYLSANVEAVSEVVARSHPDVALANHLVMGPVILARALADSGISYAVKVHGSGLEYTVKPYPRFLPFAREGIAAASGVLVGSRHTAESLWAALEDASLRGRTRLGPPGVDIDTFRPAERGQALAQLEALSDRIAGAARTHDDTSAFARDDTATAKALADLSRPPEDRLVGFVGKLILAKGIDLLLLAWPLVLAHVPHARLAIVGFGDYRATAEALVDALASGDLDAVRSLAATGPHDFAIAFLDQLDATSERENYLTAARHIRDRVVFTGRLEHDELARLLPACEAIVVPSTFPEAFGMVAVEAAACGALPISAAHSGLAEVSRALAERLPEPVRGLLSFPLGPDAVSALAERVIGWLGTPPAVAGTARTEIAATAAARYSWENVARGVIAAARGALDRLDSPA